MFDAIIDIGHSIFGQSAIFVDKDTLAQTSINVVKTAPDKLGNFGFNDHIIATLIVKVKIAELTEVVKGDQIIIGSSTYTVIGDPEKDSQQLLWTIRLSE